jgi:hypothetical protein
MSAVTAAFFGSGRRMRATVAPPTTVNRFCYWWRNLIQLRTLVPATLASATGHFRTHALQQNIITFYSISSSALASRVGGTRTQGHRCLEAYGRS